MKTTGISVVVAVVAVLATAAVIYLTPLKHINLIEPVTKDISATEFYKRYKQNPDGYVFVDVRTPSEYEKGHAEGAENVSLPKFFDGYTQFPKKGKSIVLICAGGRESGVGYGYLEHHGYLNVLRIDGGTNQWIVENLPIVKGKEPK